VHLNGDNFGIEISSHGVVASDFWAPECRPCRELSPIMEQIASEAGRDVAVAKLGIY
jgi:thioredoxin 1